MAIERKIDDGAIGVFYQIIDLRLDMTITEMCCFSITGFRLSYIACSTSKCMSHSLV